MPANAEAAAPAPASPPTQDKAGNTALHLAARYRRPEAVALLLQTAATSASSGVVDAAGDAAAADGEGGTAGAAQPARALARVRNKAGQVALHCAALGGCAASAEALHGAAPGCAALRDKQGLTPAEVGARRGHAALAAQLGQQAQQAQRQQPVMMAAESGRTLIVAPPQCLGHVTCPDPIRRGGPDPPPENVDRLRVLTTPGVLRPLRWARFTRAQLRSNDNMRQLGSAAQWKPLLALGSSGLLPWGWIPQARMLPLMHPARPCPATRARLSSLRPCPVRCRHCASGEAALARAALTLRFRLGLRLCLGCAAPRRRQRHAALRGIRGRAALG